MRHAASAPSPTRALVWSFGNTALLRLGTLVIGIVLARLLGPESFGAYAVALVALSALLSFNELGVSLAIVRWADDPAVIAPTVTTISIAGSTLLFAVGWLGAPAFATAMGDAGAAPVVQALLITLLINGIVATPAALLQREFRQGARTAIDQVNTWLGAGISIVLAVAGLGAMSLAIGRIAGAVVSGVMFLLASPLPLRLGFDRAVAPALLRFGLPLAGASMIVFLIGNLDQLVVGAVLGAGMLGFYSLATNLANWPVSMFSQPLRAVAPAAFARIQHDADALSRTFTALLQVLVAAAVPVCFLIAGAAGPIVTLVYGEVWAPAAGVLRWLAIFAAVRIAFELAYDFLGVLRRTGWVLGVQIAWVVALAPLLWWSSRWGIDGVALMQLAVGVVIVLPGYLWGVRRSGVRVARALTRSLAPLSIGIVLFALCLWISSTGLTPLIVCLLAGALALTALAVTLSVEREAIRTVAAEWGRPRTAGVPASDIPASDAPIAEDER